MICSRITELCRRLHRSSGSDAAASTAFVSDTNFRYAAPPTATGNRQPTTSDVRKPTAPPWETTAQTRESVKSPVNENQLIETGSTPTNRKYSNLRSTTMALCQPFTTTTFAKRAFRCSAPAVWNSLPQTVLSSDSVAVLSLG